MIKVVEQRIVATQSWLSKNAPEVEVEQRHLDEGTQERAYWHFGYLMALRDIARLAGSDEGTA